jgi:hypothetical protein
MLSSLQLEVNNRMKSIHIWRFMPSAAPTGLQGGMALLLLVCMSSVALWAGWRLAQLAAPAGFVVIDWSVPDSAAAASRLADRHWFGQVQPLVSPMIMVMGVFAPEGGHATGGFAVIEHAGQLRKLQPGQQVEGEWLLARIGSRGVVLQHGGQQQFYPLAAGRSLSESGSPSLPLPAAPPDSD